LFSKKGVIMKRPFVRAIALSISLFVLFTGILFFASNSPAYAASYNSSQNGDRMMTTNRRRRHKRMTKWRKHNRRHKRRMDNKH